MFKEALYIVVLNLKLSKHLSTEEQIVTYPCSGILHHDDKENTIASGNKRDESHKSSFGQKKPDVKEYLLCGFMFMKFKTRQT